MQEFSEKNAPYQISFEAYGIGMRICTNTPELLERIEPMVPPGWVRRPRTSNQFVLGLLEEDDDNYSIYTNAASIHRETICVHDAPGREYALMMLETHIQTHVAVEAPKFVFVHAGAVADGGRA